MNNIENILQYIDNLIFEKSELNLTPVQEAILIGVYQGKKYLQIAESFNGCSESYIKKEAAKLWKKLGEALGEDINSDNFRQKVERKYNVSQGDNSSYSMQIHEGNGDINICDKCSKNRNNKQDQFNSTENEQKSPIIDLKNEPELNYNYGRKTEISTLKSWLENNTKLITIYGLSGMGKTALILKLISEIETDFDYIIYRRLNQNFTLIKLENDLKFVFEQSQSKPLLELIDYFKNYRCLIILDDVQCIFKTGHLAGQYLPEFKDYSKFFQDVATLSHQSCLILISWEKLGDLEILEHDNLSLKSLLLMGLGEDSKEILKQKGLKDEDQWDQLITLYQGHPHWLNIISLSIFKLFDGKILSFLTNQNDLFLGEIKRILASQIERLSESEIKVINWLAKYDFLTDFDQNSTNIDLSLSEFWEVIESLERRCLIEKIQGEERSIFQLNSIFKTYIKNNISRT